MFIKKFPLTFEILELSILAIKSCEFILPNIGYNKTSSLKKSDLEMI